MYRLSIVNLIFFSSCICLLFTNANAVKARTYTTGIAEIVRTAFKRGINRFIFRQTSYDSDVFHYTQTQQRRGYDILYAGEACRLSSLICSHDEQCCAGRCLCRRWTITGEQRCIRKCL